MAVATADGGQVTNGCKPRERDALLAFKEGITDDPAGLLASWRRRRLGGGHELQDCCRWRGVQCSDQTAGHVIKLDLRNAFQDDHHHDATLVGEIGQSLISLEHLEYLDLSMNNLEGPTGRLPEFLGSFKSLRYLNLSGIRFSGMVPPHIGNLSNLQILDLSISTVHQDDIYYLPFLYSGDASWDIQEENASVPLSLRCAYATGRWASLGPNGNLMEDRRAAPGMGASLFPRDLATTRVKASPGNSMLRLAAINSVNVSWGA
nr:receptor-like protein EIX2 [Oryza sativa Japonica Group]